MKIEAVAIDADHLDRCGLQAAILSAIAPQTLFVVPVHMGQYAVFLGSERGRGGKKVLGVDPVDLAEPADEADDPGRHAVEEEIMGLEVAHGIGKVAQVAPPGRFLVLHPGRLPEHRQAGVGLDVLPALVDQQADPGIGVDILGMLGDRADEQDDTPFMIRDVRGHRPERIARQVSGHGGEHAIVLRPQKTPCFVSLSHEDNLRAVSDKRRPSARHSLRSCSVMAFSPPVPATWLAPYGVPPLSVIASSGSV